MPFTQNAQQALAASTTVIADPFESWLGERHPWLQTAAARLLRDQRMPTEPELADLADLCMQNGVKGKDTGYESVPAGAFSQSTSTLALRIDGIDAIKGVNAIQTNASLTFGKGNLSVIYGCNGAGKSGYARLLKHMCGARIKSHLHPNIFADINMPPSADVHITNKASTMLPWSAATGSLAELKHVHIFDSQTATTYVSVDNEATYEPRRMRFLSALIKICDEVAASLEQGKKLYVKALPQMSPDWSATPSYAFIAGLKPTTTKLKIAEACVFSAEQTAEKQRLDTLLKQTDHTERQKTLVQRGQRIAELKKEFDTLKTSLSDSAFAELIGLRRDAIEKRNAASKDAEHVFADAPLAGVGQATWRLMWEQAQRYSTEHAYPGKPYPVTSDESHCVLCQQPLSDDARLRLERFQAYVIQGLEKQAKLAETALDQRAKTFPRLPALADWDVKLEILGIAIDKGRVVYTALAARLASVPTVQGLDGLPPVEWQLIEDAITSADTKLKDDMAALAALQETSKREEMKRQLLHLQAAEWLSQNKDAIEAEVERLCAIKQIDTAIGLAKTHALTSKKNELAQEELASGYQERFKKELEALGGKRLPVTPAARPRGKGKIHFELQLVNAKRQLPVLEILSEGEARIVALSAFLADMTSSGQSTPFVFDDPISSLDQDYEERVVARLVKLAATRQVIVFTHRLSLLALIDDALLQANAVAKDAGTPVIDCDVLGLNSIGNHIGVVSDLNARNKNPKSALASLRDHVLPRLRKLIDAGDVDGYDREAKAACSDFRILIERVIEVTLLNDVVLRFRRNIKTMGKLHGLAVIDKADCHLLDQMMSIYSCFEHSQAAELPGVLPTPDDIKAHADQMIDWIDNITKRRAK